ncbi:zinc-dependent alcohol dehydrogenase [[Eubacterium] cellulosolvens]
MKTGPGKGLERLEVETPQLKNPSEVQLKVKAVSICASDALIYYWTEWGKRAMEHAEYPVIIGHEASGIVTSVGEAVTRVSPGDKIAVNSLFSCGHCFYCLRGLDNLCEHRIIFGKKTGAYPEYAVIPENAAIELPDEVDFDEGALLEPLGVAIHAVDQGDPSPGECVVVLGCGPIGILALKYLGLQGVLLIGTEINKDRIEFAEKVTNAEVFDASAVDIIKEVRGKTEGRGADFVLEATGSEAVMDQALDMTRNAGRVVTIGTFGSRILIDVFFKIARKELKLIGNLGRPTSDWYRAIELIRQRKLDVKSTITHKFPLSDFEKAFGAVRSSPGRVLLYP